MTKTTWCPVCRGEIHAIAGRCKHCKADLVDLRERASRAARAQAMGAVVPPPPPRPPMQMVATPVTPPTTMPPPPMDAGAAAATWIDAPAPTISAGTPPLGTPEVPPPVADTWQSYPPVAARSSWSRRWPLLVSAIALLAIGISIGMLAERWRHGKNGSEDGRVRNASTRPHQVPDHMPLPLLPGPGAPRQIDPDPGQDPGAQTPPAPVVPSPANPGSRFGQGGGSDPGDAGAFRSFTSNLTESLCKKLSECGVIDSATRSVCQAFAQEFDPEDAAGKVARGECSFNQRAADACLRAVADLRCDTAQQGDMMDWLMKSNQVGECAQAYVCQ
jgi:hypothetical protein